MPTRGPTPGPTPGPGPDRATAPRSTLRWRWPDGAPREWEAGFVGPGGMFELVEEDVLGERLPVFARRSPSLPATLADAAARFGHLDYLVTEAGALTFGDVADRSARVAHVLAEAHGVGRGDRVAVAAANGVEYALVGYATAALGAILVGLNGWWTGDELRYGIGLTEPALIAVDERRGDRLARAGIGADDRRVVALADLVDRAMAGGADAAAPEPHVPVAEDDPVMILFTSGTTGRPKGATLSHRNLGHMALSSALGNAIAAVTPPSPAPMDGQPGAVHVSPFFHISGVTPLFMSAPTFGTRLVLPPPGRWDEDEHLRLTQEHRITTWTGTPTHLWRLLHHPAFDAYDTSSVRTIGVGGAPLSPEMVRLITARLPDVRVTNGYGMTETTGNGTRLTGAELLAHPGTVGTAEAGIEVQVRGPDGDTVVPDGEVGEIHVRGASVFLGYWADTDATAACLDDHRWYRTGDFGRIDGERLRLESRIRDLIIRGGENVYPIEIEHRLLEHPGVEDAAVIGVDHAALGQEVKAVVVRRPGAAVDAAALRSWVADTLAAFKVPAQVAFVGELPRNTTGKVLKSVLEGRADAHEGAGDGTGAAERPDDDG